MAKLELTSNEIKSMYQVLKSFEEGLIENPDESWEQDYYEEPLVDRKPLQVILKKIESILPKETKKDITKTFLRRKYSTFNNEVDEKVYAKIEKAFNSLKTIEISYFNIESAEFSKRKVDIYYKSRRYVIGYCHLRKAIRKFKTSRISSAKLNRREDIFYGKRKCLLLFIAQRN